MRSSLFGPDSILKISIPNITHNDMILLKQSRNIKGTNKIKSLWELKHKISLENAVLIEIHNVELSLVYLHVRLNEQLY
jgi:hypothetical protein